MRPTGARGRRRRVAARVARDHAVTTDLVERSYSAHVQARSGSRLGDYVLRREIGAGGNATVWRATGPNADVAVKVLKRSRPGEPLERFRREVDQMLRLKDLPGVLPLIDAHIPAAGDGVAWLAMPLATPVEDALGDSAPVETVVELLAAIADVLTALHARGLAHRDIKPQNLYMTDDGNWAVGDFGLIDVPDAEPLTTGIKGLGPRNFLAPEMLMQADAADGPPADVYSLAKTAWVLITRQRVPPPGEHRLDVEALRLSSYVNHPRIGELDSLIAAMTGHDPLTRPQMDRVASELHSWLSQNAGTSLPGDLSSFAEVALRLSAAKRDEIATRATVRQSVDTAMKAFRKTVAGGAIGALRDQGLPLFTQPYSRDSDGFETDGSRYLNEALPSPAGARQAERRSLGALIRTEDELPGLVIWIGVALDRPGDLLRCAAGAALVYWGGSQEPRWIEVEDVVLGWPAMRTCFERLNSAITRNARNDLASWVEAMRS